MSAFTSALANMVPELLYTAAIHVNTVISIPLTGRSTGLQAAAGINHGCSPSPKLKGVKTLRALKRVNNEIRKQEANLALVQEKLDELYKQRTQLENAEMIDAIRSAKFDATEMLTVIHALKKGGTDLSALLLTIGGADTSVNSADTKLETNNTESEDNDYETE